MMSVADPPVKARMYMGWIVFEDHGLEGGTFIRYDQHGVELERWRVAAAVKITELYTWHTLPNGGKMMPLNRLEGGVFPVKRFNAFNVYTLGKQLFPVLRIQQGNHKFSDVMFPFWAAREALFPQLEDDTIFLDASKRAAKSVIEAIDGIVPRTLKEAFEVDQNEAVNQYRIEWVKDAITNLETVLTNDMPGISTYFVTQKGIYRTEDLISHADNHFLEDIRKDIPEQAKGDIREAGKCLAYEVPTACAFHLWRAVETVMGAYYLKLHGKTFVQEGIMRSWDPFIKALDKVGADKKITQFLDHIRKEYRNPQTHPEEMVSLSEAFGLFGAASSSINQMILEIQKNGQAAAQAGP